MFNADIKGDNEFLENATKFTYLETGVTDRNYIHKELHYESD